MFQHLLGLLFYNIVYSMKSISNIGNKRSRGRPATDATPILVRVPPDQLASMDTWIENQAPGLTRPEAIRRLVGLGLTINPARTSPTPKARARAAELAEKAIEHHLPADMTAKERAARKRKLLHGPSIVRDIRVDRVKKK